MKKIISFLLITFTLSWGLQLIGVFSGSQMLASALLTVVMLTPLLAGLDEMGERYRVLILPDHPTPLSLMTHVSDPVPYVLYDSEDKKASGVLCLSEKTAQETGVRIEQGYKLMERFVH